eukprot:9119588-Lingulodinium_polyedra.AAC.1
MEPGPSLAGAFFFGVTVFAACIHSSPGRVRLGYALQPVDVKQPFVECFKPVDAVVLGVALLTGMLVTPH